MVIVDDPSADRAATSSSATSPLSSVRPSAPSDTGASRPILKHTLGTSALLEASAQVQPWVVTQPPQACSALRRQQQFHAVVPTLPLPGTSRQLLRFPFRLRSSRPGLPDMPPPLRLAKPARSWWPGKLDPSYRVWSASEGKKLLRIGASVPSSKSPDRGFSHSRATPNKGGGINRPSFWTLSAASGSRPSSSLKGSPSAGSRTFKTTTPATSSPTTSLQSAAVLGDLHRPRIQNAPDPLQVTLEKLRNLFASEGSEESNEARGKGWAKEQKDKVDRAVEEVEDALRTPLEYTRVRKQDSYEKPKLPCVFLHGLFGFATLTPFMSLPQLTFDYWRGVIEVLEKNGVEVLVTNVTTSASIEDRARDAAKMIEERFPGREVNLLGHSMGGLDSRFVASCIKDRTFKVASVTTIATPHRGSPFASYLLYDVIGRQRLPTLLSLVSTVGIPGGGKAFENLTTERMAEFNEMCTDVDGVKYYSWGAAFRPGVFNEFRWPWSVVWDKEGHNDGLVSVWSSNWGEYRGTLKGSHIEIIGWGNAWASMSASLTGTEGPFDCQNFYLHALEDLAKEGF